MVDDCPPVGKSMSTSVKTNEIFVAVVEEFVVEDVVDVVDVLVEVEVDVGHVAFHAIAMHQACTSMLVPMTCVESHTFSIGTVPPNAYPPL